MVELPISLKSFSVNLGRDYVYKYIHKWSVGFGSEKLGFKSLII